MHSSSDWGCSESGRITIGAWVEGALRQLSVALYKENDLVFWAKVYSFCRTAGKTPPRASAPHHRSVNVCALVCDTLPPSRILCIACM